MIAHDMYIDFIRPQDAVAAPKYRRNYCRKVTVKLMPNIAAKLYLSQFSADDLTAMHNMTNDLFKYIKTQINEKLTQNKNRNGLSKSLKLSDIKLMGGAQQVYANNIDRYSDVLVTIYFKIMKLYIVILSVLIRILQRKLIM